MQKLFKTAAWLLAAVIVALSVVPPTYRPESVASLGFEHLAIFVATGVAFGLGYAKRLWTVCAYLLIFSAVVELLQLWAPGRHARMSDFLIDSAGSCLGVGMSYALSKLSISVRKP